MFGACPFHVPVFKQLPCTQSCWETCRLHKFLVNGTCFCPLAIAGKTMYRCLAKLGLLYLLPRSLGQMHWKTESVQWYWVLKPNLASRSVKTTCKLKLKRRNRHISFQKRVEGTCGGPEEDYVVGEMETERGERNSPTIFLFLWVQLYLLYFIPIRFPTGICAFFTGSHWMDIQSLNQNIPT